MKVKNNPFFSIIIPTYNRASIITKTLHSFTNQTYKNFEIIVVDDGGADQTREVITQIGDSRIKYYWKENGERGAARNYGANLAEGEWLNFFDSDDIAYSNHLSEAFQVIKANRSINLFCFGQEIKDERGVVLHRTEPSSLTGTQRMLKNSFVNPNSIFLRKKAWAEIKYNEDRAVTVSEDWLFHLQLLARQDLICFADTVTNYLVQHTGRSMVEATGMSTLKRVRSLIAYLKRDTLFMKRFGNHFNAIKAEVYSLAALNFALEKNRGKALQVLFKALVSSPRYFFTRRCLAVLKYTFR